MKKYLLIFCLLSLPVFAQVIDYAKDGFPPLVTQNNTIASHNKITQAEQTILGQTYENQHIAIRLNRLEKTVFNRTYPKMSYEQRMNNIIVNYKNNVRKNNTYSGLSKLERKIFNKTYDNDLPENRVSRLEEQIMGTIQSGDLNSRYNILKNAANPYCGIPIMTSGGGWRGLAGSLGNFFSGAYRGYPTGLSPQIMSPYINNYGPDYSRGFYSNHGWAQNNIYRGSNTGVTILD